MDRTTFQSRIEGRHIFGVNETTLWFTRTKHKTAESQFGPRLPLNISAVTHSRMSFVFLSICWEQKTDLRFASERNDHESTKSDLVPLVIQLPRLVDSKERRNTSAGAALAVMCLSSPRIQDAGVTAHTVRRMKSVTAITAYVQSDSFQTS